MPLLRRVRDCVSVVGERSFSLILPRVVANALFPTGRELSSIKRVDLDFSEYSSGDLYPTDYVNGVKITTTTRNKKKCIYGNAMILDTSNPLAGCYPGEGDTDLMCKNCENVLVIGHNEAYSEGCVANDCRFGGTVTFDFETPVQLLFLDMLDLDTKITYELTYANGETSEGVISEGLRPDLNGATARVDISQNNVASLKLILRHSGAVSKLAYRTDPTGGITFGDPHFKTWGGHKFDFHGQCDLVIAKAPLAAEGKGLDVHIRSTHVGFYSYIERVAMKLGEETFECGHEDAYINGQLVDFETVSEHSLAGHRVTKSVEVNNMGRPLQIYRVYITDSEWVEVKVFKSFLSVRVIGATNENFMHASGILGDFYTGRMIARDGSTIITDPEEFGQEWQVNNEDGNLFVEAPEQQFPTQCLAPQKKDARKLTHGISLAQANAACEHLSEDIDSCVYDIMATGDIELAGAY